MNPAERVFIALDYPDLAQALAAVRALRPLGVRFKVGLQLFTAAGPAGVAAVQELGGPVFLDLKLHDIPNTVEGAARAAAALGVWGVNVHAGGGRRMMQAAAQVLAGTPVRLIAVTVLTSLADEDLREVGVDASAADHASRLARLAAGCGCHGLVAAAPEVPLLRTAAPGLFIVTPGMRPADAPAGDQRRTGDPRSGGDYLVLGRSVTGAADPVAACHKVLAHLSQG